jgi:hypothetical protein
MYQIHPKYSQAYCSTVIELVTRKYFLCTLFNVDYSKEHLK